MKGSIREAVPEHFNAWLEMRKALYTSLDDAFHRAEMELYDRAGDKACYLVIAEDQVSPCGFVELSLRNVVDGCLSSPVGYIEGIYIEPGFRGHGFSQRLLDMAENWFLCQGCSEIATDATLKDVDAQGFHTRMGFIETYRIVQYRKPL